MGTSQEAVLQVEASWGDHRLDVRQLGAQAIVLGPEDEVTLRRDGEALDRPALHSCGRLESSRLDLARGETAEVVSGGLVWRYRYVEPAPRARGPSDVDVAFFKITAIALLVACAVIAAFEVTWRGGGTDGDGFWGDPSRYKKLLVKLDPPLPKPSRKLADVKSTEPGPTVKPDAKPVAQPGRPVDKKERDRAKVAGLLGDLFGGGAKDAVFDRAGIGVGVNDALDALHGGQGELAGGGLSGMGARGNGPGGPGAGLSLGGVGAFGRGPRQPGGEFSLKPGKHVSVAPCGAGCRQEISDGLPKDVVAKAIARHLSEIKFCYEQELQHAQSLAGKVSVAFTIDGTGAVAEAAVAESTLDDATLESCILARVRRWKFPEPRGGGVVTVTYPWVFQPAGSED